MNVKEQLPWDKLFFFYNQHDRNRVPDTKYIRLTKRQKYRTIVYKNRYTCNKGYFSTLPGDSVPGIKSPDNNS